MEDKTCICGHKESSHVTGRKDGAAACLDCIKEEIEGNGSSECEGFHDVL